MSRVQNLQNRIVIPLLVMLLLTLIAGGSALYLTWRWEDNYTRLSRNLTQVVILNNIRWGLAETRDRMETDMTGARARWENVQQQARILSLSQEGLPASRDADILVQMLSNDGNMSQIDQILHLPLLNLNLNDIQNNIRLFHGYSRYVSITMTGTMLILGGFLMLITARDLSRMMQQLRESREQSVLVQEEERRRLAQDLHDEVIQDLIAFRREVAERPELTRKIDSHIETMRRVCHNLKPQILEDLGFEPAVELLMDELRQSGVTRVDLELDPETLSHISSRMELPLYRVLQEALSNVARHAGAHHVTLAMFYRRPDAQNPGGVLLGRVMDDGSGFEPVRSPKEHRRFGLSGMHERIGQLGGELTVDSRPGGGTSVRFRIPL
ncbi:MAG: sensor histidine kinase [Candidatus Melainabacteria bacterium]